MANEYTVKSVTGEVLVKDETGRISRITAGQRLKDGDEIITKNGHIELEYPNGATREIAPNAEVILGDAGAQETAPDDIDAKTAPEIPDKPDQRQKTDDAQQDDAPQTSEDDTAHSFVKTPRIEYKEDFNLGYGRDVNTTEKLAGRATLNPRVKFAYNASITEETTSYHDPIRDFEGRRDDGWHSGEKMRSSYEELERPISTDTGINPPTPHSTAARTLEDGFVRINPLENYERLDGFSLTAPAADAPHGKVSIGADGALIYTPNPDFHGEDTITCVFRDQSNRTYTSEVSVTVGSVSDTTNDAASTDENTPITIDVLKNDTFADGAKITEVTQGSHGTITITADNKVIYTPTDKSLAAGESQTDSFTYTVTTIAGNTETSTVTVTYDGANDAPLWKSDAVGAVKEDAAASASTTGTLARGEHFTDADANDTHTIIKAGGNSITPGGNVSLSGTYGSITINSNGTYTYTLNNNADNVQSLAKDQEVTDDFKFTVSDGQGGEIELTITINITGTNDAPKLADDTNAVTEDNALTDGTNPPVVTNETSIFTDEDTDDDHNGKDNWKVSGAKENSAANNTTVTESGTTDITGKYGTLHISADGKYTYTLNNNTKDIQQLGHDGKLDETFSITIKDGSLEATQNLKITIHGANDAPVISIQDGDSASGTLNETEPGVGTTGVNASGTLTLSDIDTTDTVGKIEIASVKIANGSTIKGLISQDEDLLKMLTLVNDSLTATETEKQFTWNFDSGTEKFNYLKNGEKLVLEYTIKTHDDSAQANTNSNEQVITITINGGEAVAGGRPVNDTGHLSEDGTLNGDKYTDINNTTDNNLLFNDLDDGYIVSFKVDGDPAAYTVGTNVGIKTSSGAPIGTINITQNGNYTFVPVGNYSGDVPIITYTTSNGHTAKLTITIDPVADAPTWTTPAPAGNEDAPIGLRLKLPTITDNIDLNGDTNAGDHAERLGYITIEKIPTGVTIYNGSTALTADKGTITIAIVDSSGNLDTNLHYTGLDTSAQGVVKLTQAQFEALTIKATEQSGTNLTGIKLNVTSYETNDDGTLHSTVTDGASSTTTVNVDVQAVTDAEPTITINGSTGVPDKSALVTAITANHITVTDSSGNPVTLTAIDNNGKGELQFTEDGGKLKIDAEFIKASINSADVDGSEKYTVTISGLEPGSIVNAVTVGAAGTATLTPEMYIKTGSIDLLSNGLTITPSENFSGAMNNITITVTTVDTDADSSGSIIQNTATITLPTINITPVVDGVETVAVKQAIGDEDTPIDLYIKPSSADASETFNVTISGIPQDAAIYYDGKPLTLAPDGSVTINGFDYTKSLTVTPPANSNVDFKLNASAVSVESDGSVSSPSAPVEIAVTVHSVADTVEIQTATAELSFAESVAEATGIPLSNLIIKTIDVTDGSESVTLTVTGLSNDFTLTGNAVEYKGGEGLNRTWVVTMDKNNISNTNAYIKTPENFSGTIELQAKAMNTDSTPATDGAPDANTNTSSLTDVTITVTPTPEATINKSATVNEDALERLSFAINHQNGDNDEHLDYIYIKAADVDGAHGKNFNIYYSVDNGTTTMTLQEALDAGKISKDGDFYKIQSTDEKDVYTIFVQGNPEYSGTSAPENTINIKYAITDNEFTGDGTPTASTSVTTVTDNIEYQIAVKPVTDQTTLQAITGSDITTGAGGDITLSDTTVSVNNGASNTFSVKVTVNAPTDTDGSEHFIKIIVDGVPDGISVTGATYLGDSGAVAGTGRWLVTVAADQIFNTGHPSFDTTLDFKIDRGNANIWTLNGQSAKTVTVTAVSQDITGAMKGEEADSSTHAEFDVKINFTGSGPALLDVPAPGITLAPGAGTVEDSTECSLGDFIKANFDIDPSTSQGCTEYRFSFEIKGFPDGTRLSGDAIKDGTVTVANGGSITVSGFGDDAAMQSVINNIKVTLPSDYNNNTDGTSRDGMNLSVTWKTDGWNLNGNVAPAPASDTVAIAPTVTPVTDPMKIIIDTAQTSVDENQPSASTSAYLTFSIKIGAGADGVHGKILNEGKLYIRLDGAKEADTITYNGTTYTLKNIADGDAAGIPAGKYYIIDGAAAEKTFSDITYRPAEFYSGKLVVTALIASQETGANAAKPASGTLELTVSPVNSEYGFTVADVSANENATAAVTLSPAGKYDNDGSEKIHAVVLSGFDATHGNDFMVKYTVDGAEKIASKVAAGTDAGGKQLYEWVLSTDSKGNLPTGIKIEGLNHYSGTLDLTMTVVTGEIGLNAGRENTDTFTVTFHPTADGFSDFTPTLTFGEAGKYIDLNLNAMTNDTSGNGTETATVTLSGLGDGASFFIGKDSTGDGIVDTYQTVTTTYTNGQYTLSGIALCNINDIKLVSPNTGKHTVTVEAWTVAPGALEGNKESPHTSVKDFTMKISSASPTEGEDRLIYNGNTESYDGLGGKDTLFMANFRDPLNSSKNNIDFSKSIAIKNIEVIDMSDGAHTLTALSADAVKNMTDASNKLWINGGADDNVGLTKGWTKGSSDGTYTTYTSVSGSDHVTLHIADAITPVMPAGLTMAAFAPFAAEASLIPDNAVDFSAIPSDGVTHDGAASLALDADGLVDFSHLTASPFDTLDMTNDTAQHLTNVDPYSVYNAAGAERTLSITGTEIDDVKLADSPETHWSAPELSAEGSHYTYTAAGDLDHNTATAEESVTLNVARQIYDDRLTFDAYAMNDGGLGDDTLAFGGRDSSVDFNGNAASRIANMETLDLNDGAHSLRNITAKDVFDMTDERHTLTINGDDGDRISLSDLLDDSSDGAWENSPVQSVEHGVTYDIYTGSYDGQIVTLKVEDDIIQQLTTAQNV